MVEEPTAPKVELNDLMLAMDVVDTLRHRRSLAERELSADAYDRALVEKVRKIYADQGLEVSDEIIAAGVAALREDRFTYKAPQGGLQVLLARLYVSRGRWGKWGGLALALVLGLWLAYQFILVMPSDRAQDRQARALETAWQRLQAADPAPAIEKIGSRLNRQALEDLEAGKSEAVADAVSQLETLAVLPGKVAAAYDSVKNEVREKAAAEQAQAFYRDATTALARGDIPAAESAARRLDGLYGQLTAAYTLRIVQRPDARSGVWRVPDGNTGARNYYIIVEAVTDAGRQLSLPITSEEDGRTREVDMWGLRVPPEVFEQIRQDKADNGIIDRNRFGAKKRGYLTPEYFYSTTGRAITQW
jgi:hypothetical protein